MEALRPAGLEELPPAHCIHSVGLSFQREFKWSAHSQSGIRFQSPEIPGHVSSVQKTQRRVQITALRGSLRGLERG